MSKRNALEATAHHEAGHAIALWHFGRGFKRVTVDPDQSKATLGHLLHHKMPKWVDPETGFSGRIRLYLERRIIVCFAGQIAEAKFLGRQPRYGMEQDNDQAIDFASSLLGGQQDTFDAYIRYCWLTTRDIVNLHWRDIEAVAVALVERKTLQHRDVLDVIQSMHKKRHTEATTQR